MAGRIVQGSRTGLQDVPSRSTSTQETDLDRVHFYTEIKAGISIRGV